MRFLLLFSIIILVSLTFIGYAMAVESNQQLHEYIEFAKTNHPDLRAMSAMVDAERYRAKMSRGWMNPMFRIGLMNVPSKTLAVDEDPMTMLQAGIMQKIPIPGQTRRKAAIGAEKIRTREQERASDINAMSQMIRMSYYEAAAAKAELAILEAGLPLFSAMQDGATSMAGSGMGNAADIYTVDAERSEWLRKIESAKTEVVRKQATLAASIGVSPDSLLAVDVLPEALPDQLSLDSLLDTATLQHAPAVQLAHQRVREAKASLKLSEISYITDIDVMFAYGYRFPMKITSSSVGHSGETLIANTTEKQDAMLSLDVSLPLPLNPRTNQFAMIGEERMMHKSSVESEMAVLLQLKKTILEEHAELERSMQEAKTLREKIIPSRESAYRQSFAGYLNGSITLMQVSELQMKWSMAQMDEAMLRANAWALRGNLLERTVK